MSNQSQSAEARKIWKDIEAMISADIKEHYAQKYSEPILKKYKGKIDSLVYRYTSRLPKHVSGSEAEDIANVARIEFFETIKQWDPNRSTDIWPLAYSRISGAMKDHIRYLTKADPSRVLDWVDSAAHVYLTIKENNSFETKIEDGLTLSKAMETLNDKEKFIIKGRYQDDKTFKELGAKVGVSESQATRIYKGALLKLRKSMKDVPHDRSSKEESLF
jgi:RNA polymerase sigma factor (sigma-70 family)